MSIQVQTRSPKRYLISVAAALMFWMSLLLFAAFRQDGYTHGTKAVSELGAVGAPHALPFNILAFIIPGALIFGFAAIIRRAVDNDTKGSGGPTWLMLSGAMLMLAGLAPMDPDAPMGLSSAMHALGAMGTGLCWIVALPSMRNILMAMGLNRWAKMAPWFTLFLFIHFGWQVQWQAGQWILPGWGQRIGFLGYFSWFAITGYLLWRRGSTTANPPRDMAGVGIDSVGVSRPIDGERLPDR